ncbi:MAG: sugar transferase [Parcubacteria group bacterium GW2011_GWA2_45_30]|nr:MAG: sugar transferase [Parcubacteria group bacterium GW2011_GWA2_45_30]
MNTNRLKIILIILGDFLTLWGTLFLILFLRYRTNQNFDLQEMFQIHIAPFTLVFATWLVLFGAFGLYDLRTLGLVTVRDARRLMLRMTEAMIFNMALAIIIFYLIPAFEIEPRRNLFLAALGSLLFIFGWRCLANLFIAKAKPIQIAFFGINKEVVGLVDWLLRNPQFGRKPAAFISANSEDTIRELPLPVFTNTQDMRHLARDLALDAIIITREIKENKVLTRTLFQMIPLGIGVMEFTAFHEMLTGKIPLSLIGEIWFLENLASSKKEMYEFFKRTFDWGLAMLLSVPFLLFWPFIALAIKLDSTGSIFFWQKRIGKNGKEFQLVKFRSMIKNAEGTGGFKKESDDRRHTSVGKFLRKTYFDELPQIINVLRGEMSFIGPRPERPEYVSELKEKIPFYEMRLLVPPGITGWAQINMENDASVEDAPEKMQYDLYYIKNRSFLLDVLVALRTIFIILRRPGR